LVRYRTAIVEYPLPGTSRSRVSISSTIQRASSPSSNVSTRVMRSPPVRSVRSVLPLRFTFSAITTFAASRMRWVER
jgi:hypothetical protein